jgi:hypothetical protein
MGGKMEMLLFLILGLLVLGSGLAASGLVLTGLIAIARSVRTALSSSAPVALKSNMAKG